MTPLAGRALDARIAELVGIRPEWIHFEEGGKVIDIERWGPTRIAPCARYSSDERAFADVLPVLEARGLLGKYAAELFMQSDARGWINASNGVLSFDSATDLGKLLTAPLATRAAAALKVLEDAR